MDVVSPHITSAAKLRPSPAVPGSMEAAIKMWLQVGNVQKLQQVCNTYSLPDVVTISLTITNV